MIINWGDAPFKAFITVSYPRGTLTVSGEGQSYSHTGGGTHTFTVRKKGTYTVSGADSVGGKASSGVTITYNGQAEKITLSYVLTIFDNGALVGGWVGKNGGGVAISSGYSIGSSLYAWTRSYAEGEAQITSTSAFNLSGYKTLSLVISVKDGTASHNAGYGYSNIYLGTSQYATNLVTKKDVTSGTVTIDVSSINSCYITLRSKCEPASGGLEYSISCSKITAT